MYFIVFSGPAWICIRHVILLRYPRWRPVERSWPNLVFLGRNKLLFPQHSPRKWFFMCLGIAGRDGGCRRATKHRKRAVNTSVCRTAKQGQASRTVLFHCFPLNSFSMAIFNPGHSLVELPFLAGEVIIAAPLPVTAFFKGIRQLFLQDRGLCARWPLFSSNVGFHEHFLAVSVGVMSFSRLPFVRLSVIMTCSYSFVEVQE